MTDHTHDEPYLSSVQRKRDLLANICAMPTNYYKDPDILSMLKSQGAFAKYQNLEKKITPTSLNTLKSICKIRLEGGFSALDDLRRQALSEVTKCSEMSKKSGKTTKTQLQYRVKELEKENSMLRSSVVIYTYQLRQSLRQGMSYAKDSEVSSIVARCKKEQAQILAIINRNEFDHES